MAILARGGCERLKESSISGAIGKVVSAENGKADGPLGSPDQTTISSRLISMRGRSVSSSCRANPVFLTQPPSGLEPLPVA
jgi:hypothetical protein